MLKNNKNIPLSFFSLLPVLAVMSAIFWFSSQTAEASTVTSGGFVSRLMDFITLHFGQISEESYESVRHIATLIVRKSAHFLEFAALGFFAELHLRTWLSKKTWLISLMFSLLYAVSDEFHQHFVSERAPRFTDVCVDFSGSLCAILFICAAFYIIHKIKTKRGRKENGKEEIR